MFRLRIFLTCLLLLALTVLANTAENQPAKDQQGDPLPSGAVARVGTVRWRHDDSIGFVAFLPDGKSVVSVGDDQTIRLWEFPSGKLLRRVDLFKADEPPSDPKHAKELRTAALSQDGKILATYFSARYDYLPDKEIRLFDLAANKKLPSVKANSSDVNALAISPDGELLVYAEGRIVHIWDWENSKELGTIGDLRWRGGAGGVKVLFTPDGKSLITLNRGALKVWAGKEMATLKTTTPFGQISSGVVSADGKQLAVSYAEGPIALVDLATGREVRKLADEKLTFPALIYSKDGSKLYVRSYREPLIQEWDTTTGKLLRKIGAEPSSRTPLQANSGQSLMSLSPDGKTLALVGSLHAVQFFDLPTGKEIAAATGSLSPLQMLQFAPDGKSLLTWDSTNTIHRWDAGTGKELVLVTQPGQALYAVRPDGKNLVVPAADAKNTVTLLDGANGKALDELAIKDRTNTVNMLFSPDGKRLAVHLRYEQRIDLYDIPSAKLQQQLNFTTAALPDPSTLQRPRRPRVSRTLKTLIPNTLRFSSVGKRLTCYSNGKISLWNVSSGQRIRSMSFGRREAIDGGVFTPDERCLAIGHPDGTVTLYELASGQPRQTFGKPPKNTNPKKSDDDLPFPTQTLPNAALSPDGKFLAHGGRDGIVHVWNLATGNELAVFKGHTGAITAVAFAPNGKTLASASADTTALIWDMTKVQKPALPGKILSPDELKAAWQALAGNNAAKAFTAICDLAAAPKQAVPFLKEQVKPAVPLDKKRVEELIRQLDADQPATRQKASSELLTLGEQLLPVIEKTLATNPPLEVRNRLEAVRGHLSAPVLKGEPLRVVRAVEVLERSATPEAKQVLQALAAGAPEALVTKNAAAALKR